MNVAIIQLQHTPMFSKQAYRIIGIGMIIIAAGSTVFYPVTDNSNDIVDFARGFATAIGLFLIFISLGKAKS